MSLDVNMAEIAQIFIEESLEGLDVMETGLLNLDLGDADPEVMNTIFRAAHSIKGGGATFGFTDISDFAHVAETLLDEMRQGDRSVTTEAVDLLLQSVDCLRVMISELSEGEVDATRANILKAQLEAMMESGTGDATDAAAPVGEDKIIGWEIRFQPFADLFKSGNDPIRVLRELSGLGELEINCTGLEELEFEKLDPEDCKIGWQLKLHADCDRESIDEIFTWVDGQCELEIEAVLEEPPVTEDEKPASAPAAPVASDGGASTKKKKPSRKEGGQGSSSSQESSSIRVNIDKVDALINLVGELVITQSMLSRFSGDFDSSDLERLREGLSQLERNTREIQESVMAVRMLPISFAFSRFPRLVRDTSQLLGKKVELQVVGENTELDKTVLEKIGDPLVHLVRNSLDHGLETPEQRVALGKPETGHLCLNAYHEGGNIVIEVIDDGAGIDRDRVLAKAVSRGLVSSEEQLSPERINSLIFMPGFSTVEEVSDLSGRGVGMDVVRRNIADLGGDVSIRSEQSVGTTFTIRLPLTVAILDGQLVRVGSQSYIISLVSIVETIQARSEQINRLAGAQELFCLRDEYIPVLRLHQLFGITCDSEDITEGLLVVAESNGQRFGIFVDDLLEQQQVVIKSLEANYKQTRGISGATILGDGTVALILDVPGLIQLFYETNGTMLRAAAAA